MGFELSAVCRASAVDVFMLLHDPSRIPEWWEGTARVEDGAAGAGEVTRYTEQWPDFAYPTRLQATASGGCVTISCLVSDIVQEWRLEPHADGCAVRVRVELPASEAAREPAQRAEVGGSLRNLVALAEAAAAA